MRNNTSPGNDELTKKFCETFWDEQMEIFVDFVSEAKENGHLAH